MSSRQCLALLLAASAFANAAAAENVCALASSGKVEDLAWLQGQWIVTKDDQTVRERWMGPYGGVLLGVGQTTKGQESRSFEYFRIAQTPTGVSYFASPDARPPTEFKAIELCAEKVVFENKAHDFPQRVIYTKGKNATLDARIEGTIKGKLEGEDWHYRLEK